MRARMIGATLAMLALTGCIGPRTSDMIGVPGSVGTGVAATARVGADGRHAASGPLEALYDRVRASSAAAALEDQRIRRTGVARAMGNEPLTTSRAAGSVMEHALTRRVAEAVADIEAGRKPRDDSIGIGEVISFVKVLSKSSQDFVDEVADGSSGVELTRNGQPTFDGILLVYLKEYASGKFVDRRGVKLDPPEFEGGIGNKTIGGLATVFFEALFDSAMQDLPVFKDPKDTESFSPLYEAKKRADGQQEQLPDGTPLWQIQGYSREVSVNYATEDGLAPTWLKIKGAGDPVALVPDGTAGITKRELKVIRFGSNLAGKKVKAVTGVLFEFLSNINIQFVLGADFAIGDNETLAELVKTLSEVSSRRTAEYLLYRGLSDSHHDTARESTGGPRMESLMDGLKEIEVGF